MQGVSFGCLQPPLVSFRRAPAALVAAAFLELYETSKRYRRVSGSEAAEGPIYPSNIVSAFKYGAWNASPTDVVYRV